MSGVKLSLHNGLRGTLQLCGAKPRQSALFLLDYARRFFRRLLNVADQLAQLGSLSEQLRTLRTWNRTNDLREHGVDFLDPHERQAGGIAWVGYTPIPIEMPAKLRQGS